MSLILPPSSTLGGRRGGFGAKRPYLKIFGAFLAGAVIAGAAIKGPGSSPDAGSAAAAKPAQGSAGKAQTAKSGAPDAATKKVAAKPQGAKGQAARTQVASNDKPAAEASAPPQAVLAAEPAPASLPEGPKAAAPAPDTVRSATAPKAEAPATGEAMRGAPVQTAVAIDDDETVTTPVPNPKARPAFPAVRHARLHLPPARDVVRDAPVVAATEPTADVVSAPRARPERIAVRKAKRAARVQVADARPEASRRSVARRAFARPQRNEPSRDLQARNEAEGFNLVRSRVLPDGRRVSVYRRYDEAPPRVMAFDDGGRRPFLRLPFGLLGMD